MVPRTGSPSTCCGHQATPAAERTGVQSADVPVGARCRPGRRRALRRRVLATTAVVAMLVGLVAAPPVGQAAPKRPSDDRRSAAEPPPLRELTRQALRQSFNSSVLLGNDSIGIDGLKPVIARIGRAWETSKRVYLGAPQDPEKARALRGLFEQFQRRDQQMRGDDKVDDLRIASVRLRLMNPNQLWPGESDRQRRVRVATVLAVDRTTSRNFWNEVAAAKGRTPSTAVKTVCGVVTLGPSVLGAVVSVLGSDKGANEARALRRACQQTGQRAQDTATAVAGAIKDFATDPLGTLAKGIFGPLLKELHKATGYAARQVGKAIDKVAAPDLGEQWVRQMLSRSGTIAALIALVAGALGVIHAAITANLGALGSVLVRAALSGVVGSALLTVLNVAVLFVDELTTIVLGTEPGSAGKPFATFADTATKAMSQAQVPSLLALLLMLALLLGLVVVWWEMWLRAPLLYAVAFFYGPAYSASLFPPARQVLGQLNALLAAVVLMPLVVLSLLQMAVASLDGQDSMTAVLQATGLILLAAASPTILVALFSPSVALAAGAGTAAALGTGRGVLRRGRRAGSASLSAAGFARERLSQARNPGGGSNPGGQNPGGGSAWPGPPGTGPGGAGPTGGAVRLARSDGGGPGLGSTTTPSGAGRRGAGPGVGSSPAAEEPRRDPRTAADRPPSQEHPDPRDPGHPEPSRTSGTADSGGSSGPWAPRPTDGLDPARSGGGRGAANRGPAPAAPPSPRSTGSPGGGPDRPPTRPVGPERRPGTAGLPSPDRPPADPGAAQTPPTSRRGGRPPAGGGLTPPTP